MKFGLGLFRLIVVDATRGTPLVTGGLVCAVAFALGLFVDTDSLLPGWADPLNLALTATTFIAPLAVGSANAHVSSLTRGSVADLAASSPRGKSAAYVIAAFSVGAWHVSAYLLLAAAVLLRSESTGPFTPPMLLLALSAVTLIVTCTGLGAASVVLGSARIVAPALTLVTFVWLYALSYADGVARLLSPIYPEVYYQIYLEPHVQVVGLQVITMTAVLAGAIAALTRRRLRTALGAVCVAVLTGVAVAVPMTGTAATQLREPPTNPPCQTKDSVRLCVWPESQDRLAQGVNALDEVHDRAAGFIDLPTQYHEPGLQLTGDSAEFQLPRPGEGGFVFYAVIAAVPEPSCSADAKRAAFLIRDWLESDLGNGSTVGTREVRDVLKTPKRQQRTWLAGKMRQASACP